MEADLLDVFEPWTAPPGPTARSPVPDAPAALPVVVDVPTAREFLRTEGIPEITLAASFVKSVDHRLVIQDMLDLDHPALRILFWPRPGLMAPSHERRKATLEFTVLNDEPCEIAARLWSGDPDASASTSLGRIPIEILDLGWVRERVLDLVAAALGEQ